MNTAACGHQPASPRTTYRRVSSRCTCRHLWTIATTCSHQIGPSASVGDAMKHTDQNATAFQPQVMRQLCDSSEPWRQRHSMYTGVPAARICGAWLATLRERRPLAWGTCWRKSRLRACQQYAKIPGPLPLHWSSSSLVVASLWGTVKGGSMTIKSWQFNRQKTNY